MSKRSPKSVSEKLEIVLLHLEEGKSLSWLTRNQGISKDTLSLIHIFGNDNPIHIEVGSGKGAFITGMAQQNPDINYIGIDIQMCIRDSFSIN